MEPEIIATRYDATLVILSYCLSVVGAYTALSAAAAAARRSTQGTVDRFNLLLAGSALLRCLASVRLPALDDVGIDGGRRGSARRRGGHDASPAVATKALSCAPSGRSSAETTKAWAGFHDSHTSSPGRVACGSTSRFCS